jgi:thymidine phosphorylase
MVSLGAGRRKTTDIIKDDVSMKWYAYPNQTLKKDELICEIYHPDPE